MAAGTAVATEATGMTTGSVAETAGVSDATGGADVAPRLEEELASVAAGA